MFTHFDTWSVMKATNRAEGFGQEQHCSMEGVKMQGGGGKRKSCDLLYC